MSIAKPALKTIWGSTAPTNLADPGGVNATGIPADAKSIPRRWLNWILNRIETPIRYLMARGIADWDENEYYTVGDICSRYIEGQGHSTYRAWQNAHGADQGPPNDHHWIRWGFNADQFTELFTSLLTSAFPDLFSAAFATQFPISMQGLTTWATSSEIATSVGTISYAQGFEIGRYSNQGGLKLLAFTVNDCGNPNGYVTITLSAGSRITGIKAWIVPVGDIKTTINPKIYMMSDNVIRVDWENSGFVTGPHPTFNMFVFGTPPAA